jgi:hypothetical protein
VSELWDCVGLIVIDGERSSAEVLEALPIVVEAKGTAPRRHALAETIHRGDVNESNRTRFAIFRAHGYTFVAPPGEVTNFTGETHWQSSLSSHFGRCHFFGIYDAAPVVSLFRDGRCVSLAEAPGELPARVGWPSSEDDVLAAMSAFFGVPDARALLSTPTGEAEIFEAEEGRW